MFLVTGFGTGFVPEAPGTAGSLFGLLLWLPAAAALSPPWLATVTGVAAVAATGLVVWLCRARRLGDEPAIVIDEMIGIWIALWPLASAERAPWFAALIGFVLFRGFDIAKVWPASWADRELPGGWGVMLDDMIAGVFAAIVLGASVTYFDFV